MPFDFHLDIPTLAAVFLAVILAFEGYQRRKRADARDSQEKPSTAILDELVAIKGLLIAIRKTGDKSADQVNDLFGCHLGPEAKEPSGALKWWSGPQNEAILKLLMEVRQLVASCRKRGTNG